MNKPIDTPSPAPSKQPVIPSSDLFYFIKVKLCTRDEVICEFEVPGSIPYGVAPECAEGSIANLAALFRMLLLQPVNYAFGKYLDKVLAEHRRQRDDAASKITAQRHAPSTYDAKTAALDNWLPLPQIEKPPLPKPPGWQPDETVLDIAAKWRKVA